MALVIAGRMVPMDPSNPDAIFRGRVFLDDAGTVERVTDGTTTPPGFGTAPVVDVGDSFVLPGFIDLHNHIGYNALPLWAEPRQQTPFLHHDRWPDAPTYQRSITWPATTLVQADPEAVLAYVQLRALIGGTTAVQGWPTANRPLQQVLRNIDSEKAGTTNRNLFLTSALTKEPADLAAIAQRMQAGAGFIYHCAEGQAGSLVAREFDHVATAGCLGPTFIGIHCNAVAADGWRRWATDRAGAVVWSPFSNLWLYGTTTDVGAAAAQGVSVCLGSDWGPSGTKNVQGEIKVARIVSDRLGLGLTDRALVAMLTTNPGDALARCWKKPIGRLVPGAFADLTVLRSRGSSPVWTQIVASTERDVRLVVCHGIARYGDADVMAAAGQAAAPTITVRRRTCRFSIPDPGQPGAGWSWRGIKARLDAVRKDPRKALEQAEERRRNFIGPADADTAPLTLELDMPSGPVAVAGDLLDHADEIEVPRLPSLVHDAAFFNAVRGRGFHGGLLDGLATFYR